MNINKDDGEIFPFICDRCKGFYDCEYDQDGICLCPCCDKEKIDLYENNQRHLQNERNRTI
jgi:hypothetical protein